MAKRGKKQSKVPNKFSEDFDDDDEDEITKKWYEEFPEDAAETSELSEEQVTKLKSEAQKLLDGDVTAYNLKSSRSSKQSDLTWMKTMMSGGTTSDKIAAYTLMIQESPMHNLTVLGSFINMVKLGKKECLMVIQTLTELFLTDLLPRDRKLRVFAACPLSKVDEMSSGNQLTRSKHLVRWLFEHQLKELYQEFLGYLNTAARDSIEANKEKAILAMYKLLSGNPEKESFLLTNLVNKLGDPSQKVASKTIYCLTQLLQNHPAMKAVIMEEIEKLIFRANISPKAQYYGVCFLSQFYFTSCDGDVAKNLIRIYFSFFKSCVKKGDVDTRMMRILLIGVNRAFPFVSKESEDQISEHVEMLYKIVHVANYNVSLHALCLIFQVADYSSTISDRFYTALYRKLSDPQLATSSHHAMFLSLIFKALKKNQNISRGRAFIKRLLQACEFLPASVSCGILFLASQLLRDKEMLALNLESSKFSDDEDDDEEECYKDVVLDDDDTKPEPSSLPEPDSKVEMIDEKPAVSSTWFHARTSGDADKKVHRAVTKFDGSHRNPVHAGGEHCAYTELMNLTTHYHPSVSVFAKQILEGKTVQYSGDPLQDFTLIRFLDRFVFKNPKKLAMQDNLKPSPFARRKNYKAKGIRSLAVNSSSYLNETQDKIPVEELYMYQYLQRKREQGGKVNTEDDEEEDSDADSVGSDDFNEMMDNLMGGKKSDELDFADDVGDKLTSDGKKKKGSRKRDDDDDGSDDEDHEEQDSDDEQDSEGDEGADFEDGEDFDDDAEDIEFGDDGDDDDEFNLGDDFNIDDISDMSDDDDMPRPKKKANTKKSLLSKFKGPNSSIFASADEFAEMLEESGASGLKMSGSNAMANGDKAGEKQMKWEVSRDRWMGDEKWKEGSKKRKRDNKFQGTNFNKKSKKNKKT